MSEELFLASTALAGDIGQLTRFLACIERDYPQLPGHVRSGAKLLSEQIQQRFEEWRLALEAVPSGTNEPPVMPAVRRLREHGGLEGRLYLYPIPGVPDGWFSFHSDLKAVLEYVERSVPSPPAAVAARGVEELVRALEATIHALEEHLEWYECEYGGDGIAQRENPVQVKALDQARAAVSNPTPDER